MAAEQDDHRHIPDILKLACFEGPNAGTEYTKPGSVLSIGRTKASKIWVRDPSVSEKHGKLEWTGQAWRLFDMGSSNGTKVNGNALESEGEGVDLKDGDVIQLGDQSRLDVQIIPVLEESMTVEQFLRGEASRMEKRLAVILFSSFAIREDRKINLVSLILKVTFRKFAFA